MEKMIREREKSKTRFSQKPIFQTKSERENNETSVTQGFDSKRLNRMSVNGSTTFFQKEEFSIEDERFIYTSKPGFTELYQQSFNQIKNVKIRKIGLNFVRYLEKNLFCRVKEIQIKFLFDYQEKIYFLGFKKMLVKLRTDHSLKRIIPNCRRKNGRNTIEFENFYKKQEFDDGGERYKAMQKKKLLKTHKKSKCKGFFCRYTISDKVANVFAIKRDVERDLREAEKGSVKLLELRKNKYMITKSLLEKIEANLPIIDQILNLFSIVNPQNKQLKYVGDISEEEREKILSSIKKIE